MGETSGRRETHDFMNVNVESFSQLPFIRRAPVKEKGAIRLFGKEFGGGDHAAGQDDSDSSDTTTTDATNNNRNSKSNSKKEESSENINKDYNGGGNSGCGSSSSNNRRFECHYCFRNFPTSQALGGHQNAHKRERQHAKRGATYLQAPEPHHFYGFLNNYHHRHQYLGGGGGSFPCPPWRSGPPAARFYGRHGSSYYSRTTTTPPPTINGSPLGLWHVPGTSTAIQGVYPTTAFNPDRSSNSTLPLLAGEREAKDSLAGGSTTTQNRYWYGLTANVQDHVSLDLHL